MDERHRPDDPWDRPYRWWWAALTVICGAASVVFRTPVPALSLVGAAAAWPAVYRVGRRD